jgi:pimeloyl-ACP methyl ester carboxylesterase
METELQFNGRKIFYRLHGEGKTVMLLHGFGETGEVWRQQVDYLKNDFRVIVPDLPGSGRSAAIDDMSMEGLAEVIKIIIDDIKPGTLVNLVGHSMGGYITLAFVEKYAACLNAFGLFHSTAYADTTEKIATRRKGIDFVRKHGAYEFFKTSTPNLFSPQTKQQNPALVDEFVRGLHNFSSDAVVSYSEAMIKRPDRTQLLKTTNLPVLFVIGAYDNAIPVEDMLEQTHKPEKAYIDLLHHSGHMGMLEEVQKSNELLKKFVSET